MKLSIAKQVLTFKQKNITDAYSWAMNDFSSFKEWAMRPRKELAEFKSLMRAAGWPFDEQIALFSLGTLTSEWTPQMWADVIKLNYGSYKGFCRDLDKQVYIMFGTNQQKNAKIRNEVKKILGVNVRENRDLEKPLNLEIAKELLKEEQAKNVAVSKLHTRLISLSMDKKEKNTVRQIIELYKKHGKFIPTVVLENLNDKSKTLPKIILDHVIENKVTDRSKLDMRYLPFRYREMVSIIRSCADGSFVEARSPDIWYWSEERILEMLEIFDIDSGKLAGLPALAEVLYNKGLQLHIKNVSKIQTAVDQFRDNREFRPALRDGHTPKETIAAKPKKKSSGIAA